MSYVYSFAPIPMVDYASEHTGFYIVLTLCVFVFLWTLIEAFQDGDIDRAIVIGAVCFFLSGIAAIVSWNTGEVLVYENKPVTGKLLGFQAEGYNERRTSGKTTRRVDVHYTYVMYEVDGGTVLMRAFEGQTYPENAILYRNPAAKQ